MRVVVVGGVAGGATAAGQDPAFGRTGGDYRL